MSLDASLLEVSGLHRALLAMDEAEIRKRWPGHSPDSQKFWESVHKVRAQMVVATPDQRAESEAWLRDNAAAPAARLEGRKARLTRPFQRGKLMPEIERRLKAGFRQCDIARELGVSKVWVCTVAGKAGLLRRERAAARRLLAPASALELADMLDTLPPHVLFWLVDNTPAGGTLADLVRGILIDAHAEGIQ